jgi:predicted transcriptional regulator of viral defense system
MAKNIKRGALSSQLATVLANLSASGKGFFTVKDFAELTGKRDTRAAKLLHQLRQSGWVERIARGRYFVIPLEAGADSAWSEDTLLVASQLADPAAVAYWSACHHWNWTEQIPRTVFIQTPQKKLHNTKTVLGVRYRFVRVRADKFFGTIQRSVGGGRAVVTDREKTLVDALDHPELCGGIGLVFDMLPTAGGAVNWDRVEEYLQRLGSGAAYKRLGLLVERLEKKISIPDRERRIERWYTHRTGGYAPLEPAGAADGPVNARWRVRLNAPGVFRETRG